jgi:addiction module HigA family antidote
MNEPSVWIEKMTRRPLGPGAVLSDLLECASLSQAEFARRIGVSYTTVSRLINNHHRLTPDMAQRLGRFWGDGARVWLAHQTLVDEWELAHADQTVYEFIEPLSHAA